MRIHFGGYTLDANRHEMRRGEALVHLSPKAFRLLQLLATKHPNAVSKADIFAVVWPDTFVTEANLPILVKEIRVALGDDARNPRIVRTVFGFGYALDTEVSVDHATAPAAVSSIAVLPFRNQAGAEWDDVSEGISENLINILASSRRFRVVPRSTVFRYGASDDDPASIGRKLGVDCIVAGRIRLMGDELVAQVELIDIRSEAQLWGERFHRRTTDFIQLQNEIATEITSRLQSEVDPQATDPVVPTRNADAYRSYLRGRHHWNRRSAQSFQLALEAFRSATTLDPSFAMAHAATAETYVALGTRELLPPREIFPHAKTAALRALELDPAIAAAHTALAGVHELFEWDWAAAERSHQRAIELDPQYATAAQWFALHLARRGHHREAERWMGKALEIEPVSTIISANAALIAYLAGDFDRAAVLASAAIELDPANEGSRTIAGIIWIQMDPAIAIAHLEETAQLTARAPHVLANLAFAYARLGRTSEAGALESEIAALSDRGYVSGANRFLIAVGLGDEERALEYLEVAAEARSPWLSYLKTEPRLHGIRRQVRGRRIMEAIGF